MECKSHVIAVDLFFTYCPSSAAVATLAAATLTVYREHRSTSTSLQTSREVSDRLLAKYYYCPCPTYRVLYMRHR